MTIKFNDANGKDLLNFLYIIEDAFTVDMDLKNGKTYRDVPVSFDLVCNALMIEREVIKVDEIETITVNLI